MNTKELLSTAIRQVIESNNFTVEELKSWFDDELEYLVKYGKISYKDDRYLGGIALEIRIRNIFESLGFSVTKGKEGLYDAIIYPQKNLEPTKPIVLEIKSGKDISPTRSDLRQLDDWVFELSGEEKARKYGLGGEIDAIALATDGLILPKYDHPSPHKGVMIYNNTAGVHFTSKVDNWLGKNEEDFSIKRNFCVMTFKTLLSWYNEIHKGNKKVATFWEKIHSTQGKLDN
ncbi:MAG: hypothetical protein PHU34_03230 [Candidatus Methanoperedens sp.]|nr:hypothetical protein [Candidatus Methanoperedens sp.]